MSQTSKATFDSQIVRADFPILQQEIYKSKPLVYLDNGASTQRPRQVTQAVVDCYESTYANVHRGIHYLSEQASHLYEQTRKKVAQFIGAAEQNEVIFTSGTTHAINLVAQSWGQQHVGGDDEILLTIMEHHSNIVPWQQLAMQAGATIRWVEMDEQGKIDLQDFENKLSSKTKMVAVCAVSNVLGTINPIEQIVQMAHDVGAKVFVDAAQHVPHDRTDVVAWDADFITFSAHKMLGPSGIGILYGKLDLLESMPPFHGGGSMISEVTRDGFKVGELPAKFEAGTPAIAQAIGLGAAIDYLNQFEMSQIFEWELELAQRTIEQISEMEGLHVLGPSGDRAGIVSFYVDGLSTQDISLFLDRQGVAIRAGHHCAMPLHDELGIRNSCRASFYVYNTIEDVDYFVGALAGVLDKLR